MFLIFCIVMFIVFCIIEASGADWVQEQIYANRRTNAIISAISSSTEEVTSCFERISGQQINCYKRLSEDLKNEREFKDEHGRWFRERMVYDLEGNLIAKEIVGVER